MAIGFCCEKYNFNLIQLYNRAWINLVSEFSIWSLFKTNESRIMSCHFSYYDLNTRLPWKLVSVLCLRLHLAGGFVALISCSFSFDISFFFSVFFVWMTWVYLDCAYCVVFEKNFVTYQRGKNIPRFCMFRLNELFSDFSGFDATENYTQRGGKLRPLSPHCQNTPLPHPLAWRSCESICTK